MERPVRHLLDICFSWALRAFGPDQMANRPTRAIRILEEAAELCQAVDVDPSVALKVVADVYGRPVGVPRQEMGGILVTAYLFCSMNNWDPEDVFAAELNRVLAKPVEFFTRRNGEKINLVPERVKDPETGQLVRPNDYYPGQP